MEKFKQYTREEVNRYYSELTDKEKVEVLWYALDIMQGYNGQSRFDAVARAMGFIDSEGEGKTYKKRCKE